MNIQPPTARFLSRLALRVACLLPLLASPALLVNQASAVTLTWNGAAGGAGDWSAANWVSGTPAAGDLLQFGGTTTPITNNNITADTNFIGINLTNNGSAGQTSNFTLSGNRITLGGNIATTAMTTGSLTDTISLDMILSASRTITTNTNHNLTISGVISSSGGLTKSGTGTLTLSGVNTYTGITTTNAGTVKIMNNNALGSSSRVDLAEAVLEFGADGLNLARAIRVVNSGASRSIRLDLAGTNTGTISSGIDIRLVAAGNFQIDVGVDDTLSVASNINTGAGGGAGITKTGLGTLNLSGSNSYLGTTTISAGTLTLSGGSAIANNGAVTLANATSTALNVNSSETIGNLSGGGSLGGNIAIASGQTLTVNQTSLLSYNGSISGDGGLTINGTSQLTLRGNNTFTGMTTITSGSLRLEGPNPNPTIVGDITINGGSLILGASNQIADTSSITMTNGNFSLSTLGDVIASLTMSGGILRKAGTGGELTLNSASSFTGGTVEFYSPAARIGTNGTTTLGNVTFDFSMLSGNASTSGLKLGGNIVVNASTTANFIGSNGSLGRIDLNGATRTIDVGTGATMNVGWTIAGTSVGITKNGSGTLALTAANTYTGTTTLNAGSIQIGHTSGLGTGGNITFSGGGLIYGGGITTDLSSRIKNSGSAILVDTNGESVTWGTAIGSTNSGGLTKNSTGTLTLSANNTYSGDTTISAGTVQITTTGLLGGGNYSANIVNNGNLVFGSNSNQALGGVISGTGGMTKNGSGTLTLAGNNNYSGNTTINTGTVVIGHANAAGSGTITQTDATSLLKFDTTGTITNVMSVYNVLATQSATLSGAITVNNATWDIDTGDTLTVSGDISGSGGVTKIGNGTLILSGSNSYIGSTVVNTGTLNANNANALGSNNTVEVNGGTLLVSTDNAINGKNIDLGGSGIGLQFSGNYSGAIGNLTLSADSIIDLGTDSVRIMIQGLTMSSHTLRFYNWSGLTLWNGGTGADTDRVYFGPDLSDAALAKIYFYSGPGDSFLGSGFDLGLKVTGFTPAEGYQIIPVPEPETWATGLLLVLGSGVWLWRKRKKFTAQSNLEGDAPSAPIDKMVGLFRRNDPNQRQSRPRALPANSATI